MSEQINKGINSIPSASDMLGKEQPPGGFKRVGNGLNTHDLVTPNKAMTDEDKKAEIQRIKDFYEKTNGNKPNEPETIEQLLTKLIEIIKKDGITEEQKNSIAVVIGTVATYSENNVQDNNVQDNNVQDNNVKENNVKENNVKENNVKENSVQENSVQENIIIEPGTAKRGKKNVE